MIGSYLLKTQRLYSQSRADTKMGRDVWESLYSGQNCIQVVSEKNNPAELHAEKKVKIKPDKQKVSQIIRP